MGKLRIKGRINVLRRLNLRWRIFAYLLGFAIIMVVLLWLFQIVYLDEFYERIKEDQIGAAYNNIAQNLDNEDFENYVEEVAVRYNLCSIVYSIDSANGLVFNLQQIVSVDILGDCIIHHVDSTEMSHFYHEAMANPDGYMEVFSRLQFGKI
jgi:hypothetical protein